MSDNPDYLAMSAGEMYHQLGCDASKWAAAFVQFHPSSHLTEDTMLGWFANAMMAQVDFQNGAQPVLCGDHAEWLQQRETI